MSCICKCPVYVNNVCVPYSMYHICQKIKREKKSQDIRLQGLTLTLVTLGTTLLPFFSREVGTQVPVTSCH